MVDHSQQQWGGGNSAEFKRKRCVCRYLVLRVQLTFRARNRLHLRIPCVHYKIFTSDPLIYETWFK